MKMWSQFFATIALSLSFCATANAGCCYDPCPCPPPPSNCGGCGVEFGAEFLYQKLCIDELDYAYYISADSSETETVIDVEYEKLCIDYEPGVRAWLGFGQDGCIKMTVGYTYLSGHGKDLAVGTPGEIGVGSTIYHPFLAEVADPFNEIAVDWNSYYHEGEVVFGSEISCGQNHQFKPFFGVAGIYLEQEFALALTDQNTVFSGDIGNVDWKSEYWGVGLRFGSLYNYQFDQCFGLYGKFDASLLVGENKVVNSQEAILASESDFRYNVNFSQKEKCHFVPGYTVGAGFYMTPDICGNGSSISILVGYEFKAWHNIPNHRTFTGSGDDLGETAYSDSSSTRTWGTHGLVAGLQIGF